MDLKMKIPDDNTSKSDKLFQNLNLPASSSRSENDSFNSVDPVQNISNQENIPTSIMSGIGNNLTSNNIGIPLPLLQTAGIDKGSLANSLPASSLSSMVNN
ncbi:hypothetical protein DSO57_1014749 [Entomophthora muscae]|uniref:Uncharacterized protein n=1 Tax=Entomophthora muscae TaxID=34485 RepID=A0ACC2SU50_9FUNG|nr:hypothetical protein DSO57_1014749 [Entomophthora muscae]